MLKITKLFNGRHALLFSPAVNRFYAAVHRDSKPENALARDDGHTTLSDFNLSLQCSFNRRTLVQASFVQVGNRSQTESKLSSENIMHGAV